MGGFRVSVAVLAVWTVALVGAASARPAATAETGDPVLLAAGDIAACGVTTDEATAALLDTEPGATVATLGDNVYERGTAQEFADCYGPNWGRHKARTRPSPGNHEYETPGAAGYFGYFGAAAGSPGEGWYSYDLGAWHVVALNSNCLDVGGCGVGSPQERWLRADLLGHPTRCTLAYWHHPRFASSEPSDSMQAIWQALSDHGADVVLAGHQHNYERFARLGPTGAVDASGIRQFIVGTGGKSLRAFVSTATGSEVRNADTFGVLKLTLRPLSYEWAFQPIAGRTFTDAGAEACRPDDADTTPPSRPTGLVASAAPGRVDLSWQPSTDDVAVTRYDVIRDGVLIASTGTATAYTDTTVAPLTTYVYEVRARDAAANASPRSDPATVTTVAATVQTFAPVADARVEEGSPSTNFGSSTLLGTDARSAVESYLRFDLDGLPAGGVQSARLRLFAANGTSDGPAVYPTSALWTEAAITWANRPARTGAATDDRAGIAAGAWVEYDVTTLVAGSGPLGLVLAQPGTDGADFRSREASASRPELVVSVAGEPPPPDTTAPTAPTGLAASPSAGRVDLSWQPARDDVGVAGYELLRDGVLLASIGAVTTYADTTVAPGTAYAYAVRARDAAGNRSPASDAVSVTTPAAPTTQVFTPVADARVEEASPATNYGSSTRLGTDAGSAVETYLRFEVTGLAGAVQSARLRLWATNASTDGPAIYATSSTWGESTLTWANRPARLEPASDDRGSVAANAWVEYDVTRLVAGTGAVAFALAQPGTDGADFGSRETSATRPELVVTVAGEPPPPDATAPSQPVGLRATAAPGRVDLSWQAATDDVGIAGYEIHRDGVLHATVGAVTTYGDTSVSASTTYSYAVRAFDAAGNASPLSEPVVVITQNAPTVVTLAPVADARVEEPSPSTNYGASTLLATDGSPRTETYLRFDVGPLAGPVVSARLRLYVANKTADGPAVYVTGSGWAESAITWGNRPARTGEAADDAGALASSTRAELDVTALVAGSGPVSFVLVQPGGDGADFVSREGNATRRPELVLTTG